MKEGIILNKKRNTIILLIILGIATTLLSSCKTFDLQIKEWEQLGFNQSEISALKKCKEFIKNSSLSMKDNIDYNIIVITPYDEKSDYSSMAHSVDEGKEIKISDNTNIITVGSRDGQDYIQLIVDMDSSTVVGIINRKDYEEFLDR